MMSSVWQFLKKYEFWVLVAIWLALAIAEYITEDATLAGLMGLIGIVAITRLAMHPMWKKDEQGEEKATD
jgi:cadmium resistance protein CadD (predicted permease)